MFSNNNWENLQEEFFLWAQVLLINLNSNSFPKHDPLTHKCIFRNSTFGRVREYFRAIHTLAPFFPMPIFFNTTSSLTTLHPESNGNFLFFLKDYKPNQDLEL
jgi:hypothetical protein